MSNKSKVVRLRPEDDPRFQNRKGPAGMELDPTEALAWFPDLAESANAVEASAIKSGCSVLVATGTYRKGTVKFWLHNVEPSVESGFCFGDITDSVPDNALVLDKDQNIGFELKHVFEVRA